jgi:Predicted exosome subunit
MAEWPLHYLDARTFAYATEVDERVREALRRVVGETPAIERTESAGHGGAPITILQTRIQQTAAIAHVIAQLGGSIETTPADLSDRITGDAELHLTVDKQAAYTGDIRAGEGIAIRCKIEAYPATPSNTTAAAAPLIDHLVTPST